MTTVFIAGSLSIKHLDEKVQERIMNIVHQNFDVIVGDADGVDTSIQRFLLDVKYPRVTVFCTGDKPRNNLGNWTVQRIPSYHRPGSRAFFAAKDLAMAKAADNGLMIWDTKSTGTLSNIIELLSLDKTSWAFVNKVRALHAIKNVESLETLLDYMSPPARLKADTKIGLAEKVQALRSHEQQMALLDKRANMAELRP